MHPQHIEDVRYTTREEACGLDWPDVTLDSHAREAAIADVLRAIPVTGGTDVEQAGAALIHLASTFGFAVFSRRPGCPLAAVADSLVKRLVRRVAERQGREGLADVFGAVSKHANATYGSREAWFCCRSLSYRFAGLAGWQY